MNKKLAISLIAILFLLTIGQLYANARRTTIIQNKITESVTPSLSNTEYIAEQQALVSQLRGDGLTKTFSYIKERMKTDAAFARDCHSLMHFLGHESFHLGNNDFTDAMAEADEICNSGYIHGVIQSYFQHNPEKDELPGDVCDVGADWTYEKWQCAHGMGHGYTLANARNSEAAISKCRGLNAEDAITSCANGVYMEMFFLTDHSGEKSRKLSDAHISICKNANHFKSDCYLYSPTAYLEANKDAYWIAASDYCLESEPEFIATCQFGVGSQLMKNHITQPTIAHSICTSFTKKIKNNCINGAISSFFYNTGTTSNSAQDCKAFGDYEVRCIATASRLGKKLLF